MKLRNLWMSLASLCLLTAQVHAAAGISPATTDYPSIQAAIDANPGQMIYVPAGDHVIDKVLIIGADDTGLWGPGRIVQNNTSETIINIDGKRGVRLRDITLTRGEGKQVTTAMGILAERCTDLEIDRVSVINNKSGAGSIRIEKCKRATIRNCVVRNYKRISLDDRTASPLMGYAFICVDGTGIIAFYNEGTQIVGNRIVEDEFVPTKETRDKYNLGHVTVVPEKKGPLTPDGVIETRYTNNWHQGSGMIVGGLGLSERNQVIGNTIENAAQGIDVHSDNLIVANNIISNGMIGMKAMHGSKNVLITGNQFINCDLTGIWLMPGAGSHEAMPDSEKESDRVSNTDGGHVVTGNVITGLGHGPQYWNWESNDAPSMRSAISLQGGQLPENPALRNVMISGNYVGDQEGTTTTATGAPRYYYALYIEQTRQPIPQNIVVGDNVFLPGMNGVSNVELGAGPINVVKP